MTRRARLRDAATRLPRGRSPVRGCGTITALALLVLCVACGSEQRFPGWTGKIEGLVPDLVLQGEELFKPAAVAIGDDGHIYVLDVGNSRLFEYTASGELIAEAGRAGGGPGEFPALDDGSTRLVVAGSTVLVLMHGAQRVQLWDTTTWQATSFRVVGFPNSAVIDGDRIHVVLTQAPALTPAAAIHVYSLTGELIESYGERLGPDWHAPTVPAELRNRGRTFVSGAPGGMVYEAATYWPSVRAFRGSELVWERWLDLQWLEGEFIASVFNRRRSLMTELSLAMMEDAPYLRTLIFLDIAGVENGLMALLGGAYLQTFSVDGEPGKTYKLFEPGQDPYGSQKYGQHGFTLAASPDGSRVCSPIPREARVLCYALPEPAALR